MVLDCNKVKINSKSTGEQVKELQKMLLMYGVYAGIVDGVYGDMTVQGVNKFQQLAGVTVDGWVGVETCKVLNKYACLNENLKKGATNVYVKIIQTKLKQLGYYTYKVDGEYGSVTVTSVKSYQGNNKLLTDGIVGPVTYKSLLQSTNKINTNNNTGTAKNGKYTVTSLCERTGGNCLGQVNSYSCGPHSIKQCLRKWGITKYTEQNIMSYAGTTSAGTGHYGLETAIATIARKEGIKLKVEWKNFSDLGSTQTERFKKYGELMTDPDKAVFHHELYRNKFGHYSILKTVDTNNSNLLVANSLGSKCNSPAFCGYMENRGYSTQKSYLSGISQKSICIITKE